MSVSKESELVSQYFFFIALFKYLYEISVYFSKETMLLL